MGTTIAGHLDRLGHRTSGGDHVVDDDDIATIDLTDDVGDLGLASRQCGACR